MLEIEKQFKESIEKFEQKMAAFCNQLPISAKPTGESSTAIDLEIEDDKMKFEGVRQTMTSKSGMTISVRSFSTFLKIFP